jgi:zinc transport system ATP-binding protein
MESPLVQLTDVGFGYGGDPVLDGVDLAVNRGEYLGLIGPNGSGKTTLLKLILGTLPGRDSPLWHTGAPVQGALEDRLCGAEGGFL